MKIKIFSLKEGAKQARGCVVIIDVFRAFTVEASAFGKGVEKIILTADENQAIKWRQQGVGDFVMGEVGGHQPEGFDFPNSPRPFLDGVIDFEGVTIIHRSSSGTSGVCWAAPNADQIFAASFNTAEATIRAISNLQPELVSIVAMGLGGKTRADEDELCAYYLKSRLEGRHPDIQAVISLVRSGNTYQNYVQLADRDYPDDSEIALEFDSYNFAIQVSKKDGYLISKPVYLI